MIDIRDNYRLPQALPPHLENLWSLERLPPRALLPEGGRVLFALLDCLQNPVHPLLRATVCRIQDQFLFLASHLFEGKIFYSVK